MIKQSYLIYKWTTVVDLREIEMNGYSTFLKAPG